MTAADRDRIVRDAYASVGCPSRWVEFLGRFTNYLMIDAAWLNEVSPTQSPQRVATTGFDLDWVKRYEREFVNKNPYLPTWLTNPKDCVITLEDSLPRSLVKRTEFYTDFVAPQGFLGLDGTVVGFGRGAQRWSLNCSWVKAASERRVHDTISKQQDLLGHLEGALALHLRFAELERANRDLETAVECSGLALCVCDATGRLIFINATAQAILEREDGLYYHHGFLRSNDAKLTASLDSSCQKAIALSKNRPTEPPKGVQVARANGGFYEVLICPIPERHDDLVRRGGRAFLFIQDTKRRLNLSQRVLSDFYRLTGQEARVASLLADGESSEKISELLNITKETLKSHTKAVYNKTGTRRQAQLVSKLASGVARITTRDSRRSAS